MPNHLAEAIAKGLLNYNETRIAHYVVRNTLGYASKVGRKQWTRELTHRRISFDIGMSRSSVTTTIHRMKKERKLLQSGKRYQLNTNIAEWVMSRNSTVENADKSSHESRQKGSKNPTENVHNHDTRSQANASRTSISLIRKENYKENPKETLRESTTVDEGIKDIVESLLAKFKMTYESTCGLPYHDGQNSSDGRDHALMTKVFSEIAEQSRDHTDYKEVHERVSAIVALYFEKFSYEAKAKGLMGLVGKALFVNEILMAVSPKTPLGDE